MHHVISHHGGGERTTRVSRPLLWASVIACVLTALPATGLRVAAQEPCFHGVPAEGGGTCYAPADRAQAEAQLLAPSVNPDAAVAQGVGPQLPLVQVEVVYNSGLIGSTGPPVIGLDYYYTTPRTIPPIGCLGSYGPHTVIVQEYIPPSSVKPGVHTFARSDGTEFCSWYWTTLLPGRNLALIVESNVSQAAVATIGQALLATAAGTPLPPPPTPLGSPSAAAGAPAADTPTIVTSSPTATASPTVTATVTVTPTATTTVTPTATLTPMATATATPTATVPVTATPTVTTTVTATPTLALVLSLSGARHGTLTLQVRTAPHARVRVSLQVRRVPVAAHVRGLRAAATPARWTTVLAQQGAADAHGRLRRVLVLPHGLARTASVRVLVLARMGGRTVTRQAAVRLGR